MVFTQVGIKAQQDLTATALGGCRPIPFVGQEVLERCQQKGPELALGGTHRLQAAPAQQMGEKTLRQVLRVGNVAAEPADVGVERLPVDTAQRLQCLRALLGTRVARGQNDAPVRGGKPLAFLPAVFLLWL